MNRILASAVVGAVFFVSAAVATAGRAVADAPMYSDATMRFLPPAGFDKIDVPQVDLSEQEHLAPVAYYVQNRGTEQQLSIAIMVELFNGGLNEFTTVVENDLRGEIPDLFVSRKTLTKLANGMPAYWIKLAYGEGFDSMQQYLYATIDGRRGIVVAISGHLGVITEDTAKAALKNLAVVIPQSF
ncbi:MAG: hypothetical protein JOZ97_07945 [Candidatus Eremiobacteraeota bacterium]|nr:hypothetical protein [Candidatus Eremiobacteraeota bacterium]